MWEKIHSLFRSFRSLKNERAETGTLFQTPIEEVLSGFPDAAMLYDANFSILSFNGAAEKLFGVSREEVRGVHIDPGWVERPHYRLLAQILFPSLAPASVERSETGTWPQIVALTFEDPHRELIAHTIRIADSSGNPTAFVKLVRDETRSKEVLSTRNEFVGIAAHQLRTPLTALKWSLESIGGAAEKNEGTGTLVKDSLSLVDRCLKIVNDFLDAAKIEEGKFGFEYEETDLVNLLETLIGIITPIAKQYGVSVYFDHEGLATLPLSLDPSRLGTAFLNLLDNAVRYNVKGGKVTVGIKKGAESVRISVSDTGIGIPKGEERKLFQKLERGTNAIQVEPNGSGLGLYIAKNIVEGHGGTIEVASEAERGTTFVVTLPLRKKNA
ncbi:MAG: PAS domain-containing sensor histidine kinase [Candidatus Brennerbacteria bacterium]